MVHFHTMTRQRLFRRNIVVDVLQFSFNNTNTKHDNNYKWGTGVQTMHHAALPLDGASPNRETIYVHSTRNTSSKKPFSRIVMMDSYHSMIGISELIMLYLVFFMDVLFFYVVSSVGRIWISQDSPDSAPWLLGCVPSDAVLPSGGLCLSIDTLETCI